MTASTCCSNIKTVFFFVSQIMMIMAGVISTIKTRQFFCSPHAPITNSLSYSFYSQSFLPCRLWPPNLLFFFTITVSTYRGKTITAMIIFIKKFFRLPDFTFCAMLKSIRKHFLISVNRNANSDCSYLCYSKFRSHNIPSLNGVNIPFYYK